MKERKYTVYFNDGSKISVDIDEFREKTKKYLVDRLDGLVTVNMRCYRDGRWDVTIKNFWFPNAPLYSKRWRTSWLRPDIKEILDDMIGDYYEWIDLVDESVNRRRGLNDGTR